MYEADKPVLNALFSERRYLDSCHLLLTPIDPSLFLVIFRNVTLTIILLHLCAQSLRGDPLSMQIKVYGKVFPTLSFSDREYFKVTIPVVTSRKK